MTKKDNTIDILCEGDTLTYVSSEVERTPHWYCVGYAVKNSTGEYFHTRKFDTLEGAQRWQKDAQTILIDRKVNAHNAQVLGAFFNGLNK